MRVLVGPVSPTRIHPAWFLVLIPISVRAVIRGPAELRVYAIGFAVVGAFVPILALIIHARRKVVADGDTLTIGQGLRAPVVVRRGEIESFDFGRKGGFVLGYVITPTRTVPIPGLGAYILPLSDRARHKMDELRRWHASPS